MPEPAELQNPPADLIAPDVVVPSEATGATENDPGIDLVPGQGPAIVVPAEEPTGPVKNGVPDGIIIRSGDPVYVEGDVDEATGNVKLTKDVYKSFTTRGSRRTGYTLLFTKGMLVNQGMLDRIS